MFEEIFHLADLKRQVKEEKPHLTPQQVTAEVKKRNNGMSQAKLWQKATQEGWVKTLRCVCPAVASRAEGYDTEAKLRYMILETMGTIQPILDIYISMYDEGAPQGMSLTTAYIRVLAEHISWAINLKNTINMLKVGNHLFSCTLEEESVRPMESHRVNAHFMQIWNFVLKSDDNSNYYPWQAQGQITDRKIIKECNSNPSPKQKLQQVYDMDYASFQPKQICQLLDLDGKAQSSEGHGTWVYANELLQLKNSMLYNESKMWLKNKDARALGHLTRVILRESAKGQLMCFNVKYNESVAGTEELLHLGPGDKILAVPSVDKPFLLNMHMGDDDNCREHYLQAVTDKSKKHLYHNGKGVLAYIAIKYMIDDGQFHIMDCGLALGGALCQTSQASDQRILMSVLKTFYGRLMYTIALQDEGTPPLPGEVTDVEEVMEID